MRSQMKGSQEKKGVLRLSKVGPPEDLQIELSESQALEAFNIVQSIGPENNYDAFIKNEVILEQEEYGDKFGSSQEIQKPSLSSNRSEFESLDNQVSVKQHFQTLNSIEKNLYESGQMNVQFTFVSPDGAQKGDNTDPRLGDAAYICFKLQKLEFFCSTLQFTSKSPYFERCITANLQEHEKKELELGRIIARPQLTITLSEEIRPSMLLLVLDYLSTGWSEFNKLNLYTATNIVQISDCLKLRELQRKTLLNVIVQQLTRENVLQFISMSFAKISEYRQKYRMVTQSEESLGDDVSGENESQASSEDNKVHHREEIEEPVDSMDTMSQLKEEEEYWLDFFYYCLDLAAANILFIIEKKETELLETIQESVIFEIISKAINFYRSDPTYENRPLIHLLMKINQCTSAFHLIAKERQRIVQNEIEVRKINQRQPLLTWSVNQLSNCFYKQSDTFAVEGAQWRLAVSYFKAEDPTLKVQLKLVNNPFDIKKNKEYFKKKEFEVPSNLDDHKIDPVGQFEVEKEADELQAQRVDELNQTALDFPNHTFVTFLASIKLDFHKELTEPKVYSMICSSKAPTALQSIPGFELEQLPDAPNLNVGFYLQMSHLHAQILHYISKNFTYLSNDPDIKYLTKDEFKLLLKHKYLNVVQEDEVVRAICMWVEGQPSFQSIENRISGIKSPDFLMKDLDQNSDVQLHLREFLPNVNWDYVSLPCLLDIIRNKPFFRQCPEFQEAVIAQFSVRQNVEDPKAVKAAEKISSETPRYSYKFNHSQRSRYRKVDEDESRTFQTLNPVKQEDFMYHLCLHLMNPVNIGSSDFNTAKQENQAVHKRQLQQQMILKLQEAKFLENQIKALDLLEGFQVKNAQDESDQLEALIENEDTSNCDIDEGDLDEFNQESHGIRPVTLQPMEEKLQEINLKWPQQNNSYIAEGEDFLKLSQNNFQGNTIVATTCDECTREYQQEDKVCQTDRPLLKYNTQVRVANIEILHQVIEEEDFYDCVETQTAKEATQMQYNKMSQTKINGSDIDGLLEKLQSAKLQMRQYKVFKDDNGTQTEEKQYVEATTETEVFSKQVDAEIQSTMSPILSSPLTVIQEKTKSKQRSKNLRDLNNLQALSQDILEVNFLSPRVSTKEPLSANSYRAPFSTGSTASPAMDSLINSRRLLQDFLVSERSHINSGDESGKEKFEKRKIPKSRKGKKIAFTPMLSQFLKGNKPEKSTLSKSKSKHHQRSKTTLDKSSGEGNIPPKQDMSLYKRSRSRSEYATKVQSAMQSRAPSQTLTIHDEKTRALQFAKGVTSNRQKMAKYNILETITSTLQSPRYASTQDQDECFIGRHFSR